MASENHKEHCCGGHDRRRSADDGGCGHSNNPSHAHTHDVHARGYDRPLIDGDEVDCACAPHPEDEVSQKIVTQMVSQLDEVIALSSGPVYGEFIANETLHLRLIDLLNKVQEEALSLPEDYKRRKTKADWEFLQTLNGQIVHPDFGMNPETLWDIVRLEIPYQHKMLGIIINGCSHEH